MKHLLQLNLKLTCYSFGDISKMASFTYIRDTITLRTNKTEMQRNGPQT